MINTPIVQAVREYARKNTLRFHTPGHKGKSIVPFGGILKYDITELEGTDNLHSPRGAIKEAEELFAKAFGAAHSFFSVNGSTLGNLAMITYGAKLGKKIIVDRNCHISVFSALAITGAEPVYIGGGVDEHGISLPVSVSEVSDALSKNPDAGAVFVTSPNAFGITCDLAGISEQCRAFGAMLFVDEAHGTHFAFCNMPTALSRGADMCVQSLHKTLPVPTQAAILHIADNAHREEMQEIINLYQTTSPSYLLMCAMDGARGWMEKKGARRLGRVTNAVLRRGPKNLLNLPGKDALRLVFLCDGYRGEKILLSKGIVPEMAGPCYIVCIATCADSPRSIKRLCKAGALLPPLDFTIPKMPRLAASITPREAFLAAGEKVNIKDAEGRIIKKAVYCYPPGIPIAAPGEVFANEMADYIMKMKNIGVDFSGMEGDMITVVK